MKHRDQYGTVSSKIYDIDTNTYLFTIVRYIINIIYEILKLRIVAHTDSLHMLIFSRGRLLDITNMLVDSIHHGSSQLGLGHFYCSHLPYK